MQLRHENKYCISRMDAMVLKTRLSAIMSVDKHTTDGRYGITSLYFDTADDKAFMENLAGVQQRTKYRLRYYNDDTNHIFLEKKCKEGPLGYKEQTAVSKEMVRAILDGDYKYLANSDNPLVKELYEKVFFEGMHPSSVVKYRRIAYTYDAGNVRVTLDYDIRTTVSAYDFLDPLSPTIPVNDRCSLLEVKWDQYLPEFIAQAINTGHLNQIPFSKYVHSRLYD